MKINPGPRQKPQLLKKIENGIAKFDNKKYRHETVLVRNTEGKIVTIDSYKDINTGKLAVRKQRIGKSAVEKITKYTFVSPKEYLKKAQAAGLTESALQNHNPNVLKNIRLIKDEMIKKRNTTKSSTRTVVDIDKAARIVTKTAGKVKKIGNNDTVYESEVKEIINGKTTKFIKQYAQAGFKKVPVIISTQFSGADKAQISEVLKDKFLFARFLPDKDFLKALIPIAVKTQEARPDVKFKLIRNMPGADMGATESGNPPTIFVDLPKIVNLINSKTAITGCLHHELRHVWQLELVDKLVNGKLKDKKQIAMAKEFQKNFDNYIDTSSSYLLRLYRSQPLEADAFEAENRASGLFLTGRRNLQEIFKHSTAETLGF